MTGARQFARDYIAPMMTPGIRVLDVCCGDKWVGLDLPGTHYVGWDKKTGEDLTKMDCEVFDGWQKDGQSPDLILSIYGLQHLLSEEARVWTLLRRISKPETRFLYIGSHRRIADRNFRRDDPCNRHSLGTLEGLALASGWKIEHFTRASYTADSYTLGDGGEENALAATLRPLGERE